MAPLVNVLHHVLGDRLDDFVHDTAVQVSEYQVGSSPAFEGIASAIIKDCGAQAVGLEKHVAVGAQAASSAIQIVHPGGKIPVGGPLGHDRQQRLFLSVEGSCAADQDVVTGIADDSI